MHASVNVGCQSKSCPGKIHEVILVKSRQRSGHKAIKETEKNFFKLNSIKAKLKQTTTVANYRPGTHTTPEY